ncbi:MAG: hypothetical protein WKF31_00425 [Thermoleophilaceae bacterium]
MSATHSPSALSGGSTGFSRTWASLSGGLAFVTRDDGRQLVLRLSDAQRVATADFAENSANASSNRGYGQPALADDAAVFTSNRGSFVYDGEDTTPPTRR